MQTGAIRFGKCVAIGLTVLGTQWPAYVPARDIFVDSAENVTLTEYGDVEPIFKVHAARFFLDHEKLGFFRLGLAPIEVAQGVQLQIESAGRLSNALAKLSSWNLSAFKARRWEIRDLAISLFGEKEPRLRATTARAGASGAWVLSQVSVTGGPPGLISKATLQTTGPAAGRLCWNGANQEHEFFVLNPSEKTSEPQKP